MFSSAGFPIQDLKQWGNSLDVASSFTAESSASGSAPTESSVAGTPAKLRPLTIPRFSLEESRRYCRSLAQKHYENFSVASFLLPSELHPHFFSLYAYCRWADDLGDEIGDNKLSLALLDWWENELHALYAGLIPSHPVFIALEETIREFKIPESIFQALLVAFRQDQTILEYETRADLLAYCRNSANPVGRLILYLARTTDEEAFRLSDAICTGLQLANFWQDVARDWREKGRIYLPRKDRIRLGYSDEAFRTERSTPEFQALLAEEVQWADAFFETGAPLVNRVPKRFRLEISLFHAGGKAILDAIRRENYRVWERRPQIGKWKKLRLLWNALFWNR